MLSLSEFAAHSYHEKTEPRFEFAGGTYTVIGVGRYSIGAYIATASLADVSAEWLMAEVSGAAYGPGTRAMALILFYDSEGKKLQSDFLAGKDGRYTAHVKIPEGAVRVDFELIGCCFGGRVSFCEPRITEASPKAGRSFVVASAFIKREGSVEANMAEVLSLIDKAGADPDKPDLLCFTESVYDLAAGGNRYIPDDHPDVLRVREAAKKNGLYVLFTFHEDAEYRYNTAMMIDREGEVVGKYRKMQPTLGELRLGIAPGGDIPVFDLPFARIGVLICWDQYFYETSRALVKRGAEVILWPSRGYHEERMLTRARDNGVYCVSCHPLPERCCITDGMGWNILARGEGESGYVSARINTDERLVSEYKSFGLLGGNDKDIYLNEVRTDFY